MPDQSSAATEHAIIQEITAPLEGLPDDPLAVVSADFPTALRGYDRFAVDEYVRRISQLVAELQATRSPEAAVRRALERVGDQITGILQRAHETAEEITAQSRSEAEDRLQEARAEAAQIVAAGEERVRELDADTDRIWGERQRIVTDAEDLSGQLSALAREAAGRFPADDSEPAEATEPADVAEADAPAEDAPADAEPGVDETVAFAPLHDEEATVAAEPDPAEPEAAEPEATEPEADDDASTTVIRPASQAANRRLKS